MLMMTIIAIDYIAKVRIAGMNVTMYGKADHLTSFCRPLKVSSNLLTCWELHADRNSTLNRRRAVSRVLVAHALVHHD